MDTDQATAWNEVTAERAGTAPVAPAETPVPVPAVVEAPATDPLAAIQAQIAEFEAKMSGRLRNVEGHIGNLNGTQKELKTLMDASKTAATQVGDAPTQTEIKQAAANPQAWDDLKEDYPEWATATEALLDSRLKNSFDAKAFEADIKEQMRGETAAVRQEIIESSLAAVFPGWKDDVQSAGFKTWSTAQSDEVKALIYSDKVGDAAKMLKLYEVAKQSNPANAIIEQRKATLAAATTTPKGVRTTSAQKAWEDMSSDERWDYEKRQRAKR